MLKQIEGSHAMAEAIALCRPEVICAYPITPQTHIVEGLGDLVRTGELAGCEFINVESEFAALSVAIGASAGGARAYTATASQGLLYMAEAVYNASGLGLPIVMTLGNRAIGAPINIWNDHSDAMSMRDAGWMQLFAETNQEAVDLHIQAFRLAEEMSMPVMVCVDGFILTHAFERVDIPSQADVDAYLPPYEPVQVLDTAHPMSIGAMVGPDAFTEVRFLQHYKQTQALGLIPELAAEFEARFGRKSGGLLRTYRTEDAEVIAVALGSVNGTIKDTVDELREGGMRIGLDARRIPAVSAGARAAGARERPPRGGDREERRRRHGRATGQRHRVRAQAGEGRAAGAFRGGGARRAADHVQVARRNVPPGCRGAVGGDAVPRPRRAHRRHRDPPARAYPPLRTDGREHPQAAGPVRPAESRGVKP